MEATPPVGSRRLRVGVLCIRTDLTGRDAELIDALLQRAACVESIVVFHMPSAENPMRELAFRWFGVVLHAMGRHRIFHVTPSGLSGPRVEIVEAAEDSLVQKLHAASIDVVIDLRRGRPQPVQASAVRIGALAIWCDGEREDLRFSTVFRTRQVSRRLAITFSDSGSSSQSVIAESIQISAGIVSVDRRLLAGRAIALIVRAVRSATFSPIRPMATPQRPTLSVRKAIGLFAISIAWHLRERSFRVWRRSDAWFLASRPLGPSTAPRLPVPRSPVFTAVEGPRDGFFADPCVLNRDGVDHVFFEEYSAGTRRGVISHVVMDAQGLASKVITVLAKPYHLSYPFVFEHNDETFLVPESAQNGSVDLYQAVEFPEKWVHVKTLLSGVNAADSTLYHDGTTWWLFACVGEYGSSTWDELFVYFADDLLGDWLPHPANPVKSDFSSARPAGALFVQEGVLIRPAQDCSTGYGAGVVFCAVDRLTRAEFQEHVLRRVGPELIPGTDALHTVSASHTLEVVDAKWASRSGHSSDRGTA